MKLDDLKRSIDSLTPDMKLKARILALPERPSRMRLENPLLQAAALGAACLLCAGVVAAVMLLNIGEKPGTDVINPAVSSNMNLAAGPGAETALPAQTQAAPSPTIDPEPSKAIKLEPISPTFSLEQDIGVDMVALDYASDDTIIFHGYFGLFVYDLNSQEMIRSLDLEPIGCEATQGDHSCMVMVSADGNTLQLSAGGSKSLYTYTVSDNTLIETRPIYWPMMRNRFTDFVDPETDTGYQKIYHNTGGYCSYRAVRFGTGEYGYMNTSDWTIGTLTYVRGDMVYEMFGVQNE